MVTAPRKLAFCATLILFGFFVSRLNSPHVVKPANEYSTTSPQENPMATIDARVSFAPAIGVIDSRPPREREVTTQSDNPSVLLADDIRDLKNQRDSLLNARFRNRCAPLGDRPVAACNDEAALLIGWMQRMKQPRSREWTVVDVGANKGYAVSQLLGVFANASVREKTSNAAIFHSTKKCGACCQCNDAPAEPRFEGAPVKIFAFEASPAAAMHLKQFFLPAGPQVTIIGKAVSNFVGTTLLRVGKDPFDETTSLHRGGHVRQHVTTLDDELPSEISQIDLLLTDTEGFDMNVADGATRFIDAGKVGLYIFELHFGPLKRKLRSHVKRLARAGMACYFPVGNPAFRELAGRTIHSPKYVRISHECWSDTYEHRMGGWGPNAVCYNRRVPQLEELFASLEVALVELHTPCFWQNESSPPNMARQIRPPAYRDDPSSNSVISRRQRTPGR